MKGLRDILPEDEELREAIENGDAEKILDTNSEILIAEMIRFQRKKWENNRLCDCGASKPDDCDCDLESEQIKRWLRRTNRETSEKFGARINTILLEKTERGMWND